MVETLTETVPETDTSSKTELAPRWKVILHNDEITTFEFVTELLVTLFQKNRDEAVKLTYEVHYSGSAVVEITSREKAELRVQQVKSVARPRGYPLTATTELA
ncbi:MAG: ATP-dependent Clp protease adaptor ClpS [Planctomycetes bacterium]|nr:ATP-dependent Clp protease adaptor ClpS [Planctomycetota bacterium]